MTIFVHSRTVATVYQERRHGWPKEVCHVWNWKSVRSYREVYVLRWIWGIQSKVVWTWFSLELLLWWLWFRFVLFFETMIEKRFIHTVFVSVFCSWMCSWYVMIEWFFAVFCVLELRWSEFHFSSKQIRSLNSFWSLNLTNLTSNS